MASSSGHAPLHGACNKTGPKRPKNNLSDLSELAPCKPDAEPKDKSKSEMSETNNCQNISDLALSLGPGPLHGACKGPCPKGPTNYLSDLSDLASSSGYVPLPSGLQKAMSERSDKYLFEPFGPGPLHAPRRGPEPKDTAKSERSEK